MILIGKNPPESGLYGLVKHGRPTKKPTFAMQQVVAYQWKIKIADNMEAMQFEMLSWEEIKSHYPDEWVVLGDPIFEGTLVLQGAVLSHHPDKRVASIEGGERRKGFKSFTLIFTGQDQPIRRIGLLRTLPKAR